MSMAPRPTLPPDPPFPPCPPPRPSPRAATHFLHTSADVSLVRRSPAGSHGDTRSLGSSPLPPPTRHDPPHLDAPPIAAPRTTAGPPPRCAPSPCPHG